MATGGGESGFLAGAAADATCFAVVSAEPVSIWTTCLKEEVSAWMKVVGYGLESVDLERDFGVRGGGGGAKPAVAAAAVAPLLLLIQLPLVVEWGELGCADRISLSWRCR